ncbi:MAG: hypothetical protein ABI318_20280, partial [Chthoniobacteraceae bacterium]
KKRIQGQTGLVKGCHMPVKLFGLLPSDKLRVRMFKVNFQPSFGTAHRDFARSCQSHSPTRAINSTFRVQCPAPSQS